MFNNNINKEIEDRFQEIEDKYDTLKDNFKMTNSKRIELDSEVKEQNREFEELSSKLSVLTEDMKTISKDMRDFTQFKDELNNTMLKYLYSVQDNKDFLLKVSTEYQQMKENIKEINVIKKDWKLCRKILKKDTIKQEPLTKSEDKLYNIYLNSELRTTKDLSIKSGLKRASVRTMINRIRNKGRVIDIELHKEVIQE
jgi:chromosome segregation ATPase